jgi:glycosyltransferase involved in cell wall biosynthesis
LSKKKKKAGAQRREAGKPQQVGVRLSQCMIVRNEERHIERALGWAKDFAFEQIVVDTGSTDRTVEIAEGMGAKVYYFEWINDFSAAKNYAIEQAEGNWIAFLDADEYFSPADTRKLMGYLNQVDSDRKTRKQYLAIGCPLHNIDDTGRTSSIVEQIRIFRNIPVMRYDGRIHEALGMDMGSVVWVNDIKIIHSTSSQLHDKKRKSERNIEILREELAEWPDDMNVKLYLADALLTSGDEANQAEAEKIYAEAVDSGSKIRIFPALKQKAFLFFMDKYAKSTETLLECEQICQKGLVEFPGCLDFEYFLAVSLNGKGEFGAAWELLSKSESKLAGKAGSEKSIFIPANPKLLYNQMIVAAHGLSDTENIIKYATMILSADKADTRILQLYIATLMQNGASADEAIALLKNIYDHNDPNDLLLIARTAKNCNAIELAKRVMEIAGERIG